MMRERVPLSSLTTLRVGGPARYVADCATLEDLTDALSFAKKEGVSSLPLGSGSNLLARDEGYEGVLLRMRMPDLSIREVDGRLHITAGAGIIWDALVDIASVQGVWGIENLAGIPGTVGAAPVQNIGAYGCEVKDTIVRVDAFDRERGEMVALGSTECAFGYRDSAFKRQPNRFVITGVTFSLSREPAPRLAYADLAAYAEKGIMLNSPRSIASAVREIRSRKFPDLKEYGTAGSFFKNPIVSAAAYGALKERYSELPGFPDNGAVKVSLAWILDHVLSLRGYALGPVSLFERQPLVLVTHEGATAHDVDVLAEYVAQRVHDATNITIEREVRSLT